MGLMVVERDKDGLDSSVLFGDLKQQIQQLFASNDLVLVDDFNETEYHSKMV